jgi:hypothetical protein
MGGEKGLENVEVSCLLRLDNLGDIGCLEEKDPNMKVFGTLLLGCIGTRMMMMMRMRKEESNESKQQE